MSEQGKAAAEHKLCKSESNVKVVTHKSCQCYFRTETLQLIFIDEAEVAGFEKTMDKLCLLIDEHHKAKANYSEAIENYGIRKKDIANQNDLSEYKAKIANTEALLKSATEKLQQELGDFNEQTGYSAVVELIPLQPLKKSKYGRRYSYIKECDFKKFEGKLIIIPVDVSAGDGIFKKDDDGNIIGIDIDSLKKKLAAAKNTIKQMMDSTMTVSANVDYEATLTEWADAWNSESGEYNKEGHYIDVSAGAQFLRFTANASTLNTWNPDTGAVQIKGEAHSGLTLCSGTLNTTLYVPDRTGWPLKFMVNDTKEANIGILRARIDGELTGYVGASAQAEGNLQFVTYNKKQLLMGNRTPGAPFSERQNGVKIKDSKENPKSLEIKAEAFGGAKAGASLGGALQWLKPFSSLVDELPNMLHTFGMDSPALEQILPSVKQSQEKQNDQTGEFQDFACLKVGGDVELGVGLSGEFKIRFVKGRFRFHIKGSLCLGPGAKGEVEGEVSPELFGEFAIWVIYQLYGIDYKHLKIIAEDAFLTLAYILVMGGVDIYKQYYYKVQAEARNVYNDFSDFVHDIAGDISNAKKTSEKRNDFAKIINDDSGSIFLFSPEAKGIALYILTGDGAYDRIDINNQGDGFLPDTNKKRKTAVLYVLSSIQTKREWKKVLSRISKDGTALPGNEDAVVKRAEENIRNFLQIGFNKDKELEAIIDKLELREFNQVFKRLKENPAYGYAFSPNCTKQYILHCDDNPFYSSLCHFGPVNSEYKQKWEAND